MNIHLDQPLLTRGKPADQAGAAMILCHGRGASADSILELAAALPHPEMVYLAPQAKGHSWYPYSFLAPLNQNEPALSSGLQVIGDTFSYALSLGIPANRIVLAGFSQGACLISEYMARNPQKIGGLLVFSGGVIGPLGSTRSYSGSLEKTPVFIGCSDIDAHIPLARVEETAEIFKNLGANVNKKIYPGMNHIIIQDEIIEAMKIVDQV